MQVERKAYNNNKQKIIDIVNNLKDDEYLRLRRLSPRESLRLMGISDNEINKMLHPERELKKMGYSDEDIKKMIIHKNNDADIYKQAGNSIVVDVLYNLFKKMFIEPGIESGQSKPLF
jgi:site-specific DNA-cytosine methylase